MNPTTTKQPQCRFCYSYVGRPPSDTTVAPCVTYSTLYTPAQHSEANLLRTKVDQLRKDLYTSTVQSTLVYTSTNQVALLSTLQGERVALQQSRYLPYRPYQPEFIPSSLIEFEMRTANAGLPQTYATVANCKGVQSFTR